MPAGWVIFALACLALLGAIFLATVVFLGVLLAKARGPRRAIHDLAADVEHGVHDAIMDPASVIHDMSSGDSKVQILSREACAGTAPARRLGPLAA